MGYLGTYLVAAVVFLAVDAVWLKTVMAPMFERRIGSFLRDDILLGAAAGFYAVYVAGIIYFCIVPALKSDAVVLAGLNGALLGFLAYGTYEATNMTTIKGWTWSMVAIDTGWGIFLTALTAVVGYYAGRAFGLAP